MEKLTKILLTASMAIGSALLSTVILAHHSTAGFDKEKVVRIEGTISSFRWTNPHASFKLEGTVDGAPGGKWTIEMTAPNILINSGWKRTSLNPGDKVVIFANPPVLDGGTLKDGTFGGLYVGAILADGTSLGSVSGEP